MCVCVQVIHTYIYIYIHFWVNYNDLTDITGMMVEKGDHPKMALFQVSIGSKPPRGVTCGAWVAPWLDRDTLQWLCGRRPRNWKICFLGSKSMVTVVPGGLIQGTMCWLTTWTLTCTTALDLWRDNRWLQKDPALQCMRTDFFQVFLTWSQVERWKSDTQTALTVSVGLTTLPHYKVPCHWSQTRSKSPPWSLEAPQALIHGPKLRKAKGCHQF